MALTDLTVNQGQAGTEPWPVVIDRSLNAVRTTVPAQVTAVDLLTANANRTSFSVYNDSSATLFLIFGAGGGVTDYSVLMTKQAYFEMAGYTGVVRAVWSGASGQARVTEFTL